MANCPALWPGPVFPISQTTQYVLIYAATAANHALSKPDGHANPPVSDATIATIPPTEILASQPAVALATNISRQATRMG